MVSGTCQQRHQAARSCTRTDASDANGMCRVDYAVSPQGTAGSRVLRLCALYDCLRKLYGRTSARHWCQRELRKLQNRAVFSGEEAWPLVALTIRVDKESLCSE